MNRRVLLGLAVAISTSASACAASSDRTGFEEPQPPAGTPEQTPPGDFGNKPQPPAPPPPEVAVVYGHSADTLYKLDPATKAVTVVGDFKNSGGPIIDIALDADSNLYGTNFNALYLIDKTNADCKQIATGTYPNSLSFVPKGTVDPNEEALVGYEGSDYVRIDVHTGQKTKIGSLGAGALISSGDIVSVKDGKTFLTVKGGSCDTTDCLVEVDPATGKMTKNWNSIGHKSVFGLSFWAGKVYGFDDTGNLFEVEFNSLGLKTTLIPIPQAPATLSFWGAGSTTSAPVTAQPQ